MTKTIRPLTSAMRIEHLIGHKVKATIGQAYGVGKSESQARLKCEVQAVDILEHQGTPRIEIRKGYLIISQVESDHIGWYLIKRVADLKDGFLHPSCMMDAKNMMGAIESHLAQYMAGESGTDTNGEEEA